MSKPTCDWCQATEEQDKVGEDWTGHIYVCQKCSHEYVVPCRTEEGTEFWRGVTTMVSNEVFEGLENRTLKGKMTDKAKRFLAETMERIKKEKTK